ncbi:acyl-CoA dehydrogenase family protein, partial [Rhodovulum sulfidophilum]
MLTEEQDQIREAARAFAQGRLAPGAAARDRDHAFPRAELTELGELGFMGMLVPEAHGGSDTGML